MSDPGGPFPGINQQAGSLVNQMGGPGSLGGDFAALAVAPQLMIQSAATGQDFGAALGGLFSQPQTQEKEPANSPVGNSADPFADVRPPKSLSQTPSDPDPDLPNTATTFGAKNAASSFSGDAPGFGGLVQTIATNKGVAPPQAQQTAPADPNQQSQKNTSTSTPAVF